MRQWFLGVEEYCGLYEGLWEPLAGAARSAEADLISTGTHERAVIDAARFTARVLSKGGSR
ncbi:hypothetical protein AB0M50_31095 [Nonomuraea fuscirosea]|uniref:hypothetical protein n=1 Tax=Nonomuraea fuscirosea TaxID=1291556 RepID=UPI002DD93227|nr:hypothetical protein [Nonomuraea fuscirosea]WSA58638.1 hypothetical protein OIE67_20500 [Nonomuraea fuscirosea]